MWNFPSAVVRDMNILMKTRTFHVCVCVCVWVDSIPAVSWSVGRRFVFTHTDTRSYIHDVDTLCFNETKRNHSRREWKRETLIFESTDKHGIKMMPYSQSQVLRVSCLVATVCPICFSFHMLAFHWKWATRRHIEQLFFTTCTFSVAMHWNMRHLRIPRFFRQCLVSGCLRVFSVCILFFPPIGIYTSIYGT